MSVERCFPKESEVKYLVFWHSAYDLLLFIARVHRMLKCCINVVEA